ncbi:hypothetical protein ACGK9R_15325 [Halomonas sp. HNIBRBA4712]|uniref:hypothetical protein n=1 Tax=Halomonas sp. HNIBRBA4712 TaxID=3373087 RepID=UPI0037462C76
MNDKDVVVVEESSQTENKKAFIVTPIGNDNTNIRRATDGLIKSVLEPILFEFNYEPKASHQENDLGSISIKVIKHLLEDDLVIVNLSHLNANVMYELGIRHATGKPVILICEENTELPFDTRDQRTIFYNNDMMGGIELAKRLKAVLSDEKKLLSNESNPIYMAAYDSVITKSIMERVNRASVSTEEKNLVELVLGKMEKIEKNLYNKNANHSMIESKFDNIFSAFVIYIKHSIDNIGFIRYKDYLYAGYDSSFLLEISRKELIKEGFIVEEIYEKEGVHVMRVKNSDIQEAYKFESIIRNNLLPF